MSERVDWANKDVIAVLRMMDGDKSITLSTGRDLIEGLTGRRVDAATVCRHLRLLRESCREKLCSVPVGGGIVDAEKEQQTSTETIMETVSDIVGRNGLWHVDMLRDQCQAVEILRKTVNNSTSERAVESGSEASSSGTASATSDASCIVPNWSRILTSRSANEPFGLNETLLNSCGHVQDEGARYNSSEGFCVKKEADLDVAVISVDSSYSKMCSAVTPNTESALNCGINTVVRVDSLPVHTSHTSSRSRAQNPNFTTLSQTTSKNSRCVAFSAQKKNPLKTALTATNIRSRSAKTGMPARYSTYNTRRYNLLLKNARRIATESSAAHQAFNKSNDSVASAETNYASCHASAGTTAPTYEHDCTKADDTATVYDRSCASNDNVEVNCGRGCTNSVNTETICGRICKNSDANASLYNGGTIPSSRAVSDEATTSTVECASEKRKSEEEVQKEWPMRERRVEHALCAIEGLLCKVGASSRDEFNNLGKYIGCSR
ncbi:unnamed protein product [Toxocara canis]|uniref:SAM domain-containing protein n=1 Tax=Toxocara canis TaxID=6265 RepID=A0A183UDM8_TOXCA|nr:unnamed protein product [Toxocara canis]